jgi:hypothetical protein
METYHQFDLEIRGRALPALDLLGKSDPYYIAYTVPSGGSRRQLCRSETKIQDLSPDWKPQVLYVSDDNGRLTFPFKSDYNFFQELS